MVEQLQLKTLGREVINISTITTKRPKPTACTMHEVAVAHNDGSYAIIPVYALERITGEIPTVKVKPSSENAEKPWKIQVSSTPDVDLLIGADWFWDFNIKQVDNLSNGLRIVESSVGYMAAGRLPAEFHKAVKDFKVGAIVIEAKDEMPCVVEDGADDMPSKKQVETFIAIESMGITDDAMVSDDDLAAQQYAKTTTFKGKRYHVAYPYNSPYPDFPDNENLCKKRLNAFWCKYRKHPEVLRQVDDRFKDQKRKEIIEEATEMTGKHKHNLPFQIVLTPNKNTTKMRIVYDASARIRGHKSLNDNLFRGPVMLPDLTGLVIVLRTGEIVVVGDIEQAFLQISVRPEDRDITRFMWLKDITKPPTDDNIIVYRFTRVVFGIISSPFLLSATIKTHLQHEGSELAKELSECIYSDNVLILAVDDQEAISKTLRAKEIFSGASMNLREFMSNSTTVNRALNTSSEQLSSFLGISWDTATDCFILKANVKPSTDDITKRVVLKQLASVYDPQGLQAPGLLPAKLVFQETWQQSQDWNQPISVELRRQWKNAVADWSHVVIHVPRYVVSRDKKADLQLHAFADASKKACGVAVYVRCAIRDEVQVHILFGKSRLIPLKIDPTMPRRELISTVLGIRALKFVAKHLRVNLSGKYLWSDSKVVISWILSDTTSMPVFLRNRVQEIQQSRDTEVGYVSTTENPADIASRGCTMSELRESKLWWHGPSWLPKPITNWPHATEAICERRQFFTEEEFVKQDLVTVQAAVLDQPDYEVIRTNRYSSYYSLAHATVMTLRAAAKWRQCLAKPLPADASYLAKFTSDFKEPVKAAELVAVRTFLLQQEQKMHPPTKQDIHEWSLAKDPSSGLYVCVDRLKRSELPVAARMPVFLQRKSYLLRLLILQTHEAVFHAGVQQTLAELRRRTWCPKGRLTVKTTYSFVDTFNHTFEPKPF